jgi:hypothetical protein
VPLPNALHPTKAIPSAIPPFLACQLSPSCCSPIPSIAKSSSSSSPPISHHHKLIRWIWKEGKWGRSGEEEDYPTTHQRAICPHQQKEEEQQTQSDPIKSSKSYTQSLLPRLDLMEFLSWRDGCSVLLLLAQLVPLITLFWNSGCWHLAILNANQSAKKCQP